MSDKEKQLFSRHSDSALWVCPACWGSIKATWQCLFCRGALVSARCVTSCHQRHGNFKVTLCGCDSSPFTSRLTWFGLALGGSGCRRSGSCRRTVTGWWHPGPSAEPWPHGWARRRLWQSAWRIRERERTMWDKGDTGTFSKVFSDIAEVQGNSDRKTAWAQKTDSFERCTAGGQWKGYTAWTPVLDSGGKLSQLFFLCRKDRQSTGTTILNVLNGFSKVSIHFISTHWNPEKFPVFEQKRRRCTSLKMGNA